MLCGDDIREEKTPKTSVKYWECEWGEEMNKTKYSDDPKTFFFFVFVECISFDLSRQTVFHRLCTAQNADTALNVDCCCDKHTHVHMYIYIWCSRRMLHKRQFQEAKARWRKETNMINAMPCNIIYAYRVDLVLIVDRASAVLKFFTQALATVSDWQTQNPSYRLQSCSPDVWYCRAYCLSTAPLLIAYVCCNLCLHLMLFTDTGNQFSCLSLYVWCVRMWLRAI